MCWFRLLCQGPGASTPQRCTDLSYNARHFCPPYCIFFMYRMRFLDYACGRNSCNNLHLIVNICSGEYIYIVLYFKYFKVLLPPQI